MVITEIEPGLFLSDYEASGLPNLINIGVRLLISTCIVSPIAERYYRQRLEEHQIVWHILQIRDIHFPREETALANKILDSIFPALQKTAEEGGKSLTHCELSHSRSPGLIIAFLIDKNGWGFKQALQYVKERHPQTRPAPDTIRFYLKTVGQALPEWYHDWWAVELEKNRKTQS